MRDLRGNQLLFRAPERRRIRQPDQDDVGRAIFAAELCQMIDGMKGLHKLMFGREVSADETKNVRFFLWNLGHDAKTLPELRPRCQAELSPVEGVAMRAKPRCRQAFTAQTPRANPEFPPLVLNERIPVVSDLIERAQMQETDDLAKPPFFFHLCHNDVPAAKSGSREDLFRQAFGFRLDLIERPVMALEHTA